jgi:23S rRNA (pseudouridine1915-N3)-methyltransferase
MARELLVVWAGRHRRDEWNRLCERYRKRIRRFVKVTDLPVRVRSAGSDSARLRAEGEALLAAVPARSWVVALDRRGTIRDSEQLAEWLDRLVRDWPHPVAFLVGSDLGLAESVRSRTREMLSFGPLTLPHELARVVLYEQLYRGFCILAGIKYHRQPL